MKKTDPAAGPGKSGRFLWTLSLAVALATPLTGSGQEQGPAPSVDKLLAAIVGVRARVPEDARTAQALGTERVGSGVVIDSNGLIVTIG